jgi:predicted nucleic acid-binding protein
LIVTDASVLVDFLLNSAAHPAIPTLIESQEALAAPAVVDIEVAQVLRRLLFARTISPTLADEALGDFLALRIDRYAATEMLPRIWGLKNNISAYDAAYVVLAEMLDVPLYTRDAKLAAATGHDAKIILI